MAEKDAFCPSWGGLKPALHKQCSRSASSVVQVAREAGRIQVMFIAPVFLRDRDSRVEAGCPLSGSTLAHTGRVVGLVACHLVYLDGIDAVQDIKGYHDSASVVSIEVVIDMLAVVAVDLHDVARPCLISSCYQLNRARLIDDVSLVAIEETIGECQSIGRRRKDRGFVCDGVSLSLVVLHAWLGRVRNRRCTGDGGSEDNGCQKDWSETGAEGHHCLMQER